MNENKINAFECGCCRNSVLFDGFLPTPLVCWMCCVLHGPIDMLLLLYGCCTIAIWWRWALFGSLSIFSSSLSFTFATAYTRSLFPFMFRFSSFFFFGSYIVFPFSLSLKAMRYAVGCWMLAVCTKGNLFYSERHIFTKWSMIQCNGFLDPRRGAHFQ